MIIVNVPINVASIPHHELLLPPLAVWLAYDFVEIWCRRDHNLLRHLVRF